MQKLERNRKSKHTGIDTGIWNVKQMILFDWRLRKLKAYSLQTKLLQNIILLWLHSGGLVIMITV